MTGDDYSEQIEIAVIQHSGLVLAERYPVDEPIQITFTFSYIGNTPVPT